MVLGGLVVLALFAALLGPYFVDWSTYRADFEREASRILGRQVTVEGDARARLLPFPSVTFTDVTVAGAEPGETAMTVDTFSMDAELAPLLRGEVLIYDMRLVRPHATLSMDADGAIDWAMRPSGPFDAGQIEIENLTVTEGEVTLRHAASGRDYEIREINTEVSARTLAGPWRVKGSLRFDGMLTALSATTGTVDEEGGMRLRVVAQPEIYDFTLQTDGRIGLEDGVGRYVGEFGLDARNFDVAEMRGTDGDTFEIVTDATGEGPPAYRVSGAFDLDHRTLDVAEFRYETGPLDDPYVAEGNASVQLGDDPRFAIEADGAQIRFAEATDTGEAAAGLALEERLMAVRETILDLPRPTIPGEIDVNLPAIVAGDTTIRDIRLTASPASGGWSIAKLDAVLPGRTTLEADGLLKVGELDVGFDGSLLLAIKQPSGFAAWLSRDVDDAIRRLPAAGFRADVELGPRRQTFENLELVLGDATFNGRLAYARPRDARPSMALDLSGGRLDLEDLTAFASIFVSDTGESRLADHDLDFKIEAGPVSAGDLTARNVDAALSLDGGALEIERFLVSDLAGATLSATGNLTGLPAAPTGRVDATVSAGDLAPLSAVLFERFPGNALVAAIDRRARENAGLFADTRLDITAESALEGDGASGVSLTVAGETGGSELSLTASSPDPFADPYAAGFSSSLTVRNEDAAPIYALIGIPSIPIGIAGPAEAVLSVDGTAAEFAFDARISGPETIASLKGNGRRKEENYALDGALSVESADLEPWLMTAAMPLPGMGLGMPVELDAEVNFADELLVVSGLSGRIDGNTINGDINVEQRDGTPHLTGSLAYGSFDLALPAAMIVGEEALASDDGTWPGRPFASGHALAFTVDMEIKAERLIAGGFTARDARFLLRVDGEGLRASDIAASMERGTVGGLFEISNNAGSGLFSAQFQIRDAALSELLPDTGLDGIADVSAGVSASGKSVEAIVAALSGSGSAAVRDLTVSGIDPAAFAEIMERADEIGREIDAGATAAFAPSIIRDGSLSAEQTELAFTVAGGVVRAPPLTIESGGTVVTAELRADLSAKTVSANGEIVYDPLEQELVGSEPSVGFAVSGRPGDTDVDIDTQPLAQFLTQRALEREQARVEKMQSVLLEKQRLRREARYYAALRQERDAAAEEAQRRQDEQERRAAERARREAQEAQEAQEQARQQAEQEAAERRAAEERARRRQSGSDENPNVEGGVERAPLPPPRGRNGNQGAARDTETSDLPGLDGMFSADTLSIDNFLNGPNE